MNIDQLVADIMSAVQSDRCSPEDIKKLIVNARIETQPPPPIGWDHYR